MRLLALSLIAVCALPVLAAEPDASQKKAKDYAASTLRGWSADPAIVSAILDQNSRHAGLTQDDIDRMDAAWRAELDTDSRPTIDAVLTSGPSVLLRQLVENTGGMVTEAFVMDAVGLNVAASGTTSDYWQGDEAKFTETFPLGPDAVHLSDIELDESTQVYQIQVSFAVVNPADGMVIGAMTVALNAENL